MPTDPCNSNPTSTGKETFAGLLLGLDNDGNDLYDGADLACRRSPSRIDFSADKKTDLGVWRRQTGFWYVLRSSDNVLETKQWGAASLGDILVPGDYDGDGKTDYAVWRPSTGFWYVLRSSDNVVVSKQWGLGSLGDNAVVGDYDGDGKTDIAVWRPSTGYWYILRSSDNVVVSKQWGLGSLGDIPVPGDYDGDGKTDIAVWRPSTGYWYILRSSDGVVVSSQWGSPTDVPVPGDYDGDGKTDIAVWRPSTGYWFIQRSSVGVFDYNAYPGDRSPTQWGDSADVPVPGDYDGDGKTDVAVWRPSNGIWYILRSSNGIMDARQWGLGSLTDDPIKSKY